ncbi:MAG: DUF3857 domain-containing protein [Rickettsiales bacterium]
MFQLSRCIFFIIVFSATIVHGEARLAPELEAQAKMSISNDAAEVLYSKSETVVLPSYHWETKAYISIRINDLQAARDYGRLSLRYNHYYSELELDYANVLTPRGTKKTLQPDAIQEKTGGGQDFYEDVTMLVFSLPEIAPGTILEFQYTIKSNKLTLPNVFSNVLSPYWYQPTIGGNGGRLDPVRVAEFTISAPKSINLFHKDLGPVAPGYNKSSKQDRVIYKWEWHDLEEVPVENMMPSYDKIASRVRVSSSKDWRLVDQWTWGLVQDKFSPHPEVIALASSLVAAGATKEEKIKAVYKYLQENIRYVFAHLGRGGYEPHYAHEVINQGYGDCKDQSVLAIALLRALGVPAYPSLVVTPRTIRPEMDLVRLPFDHMIVWVKGESEKDQGIWFDTTPDRALYPGIMNVLVDQPIMIINGDGGVLTNLNKQLDINKASVNLRYSLDENNQPIADVEISLSGIYEQNIRNWWVSDNNRETSIHQFVQNIFPEANSGDIDVHVTNKESLWQPLGIKATFNFDLSSEEGEPLKLGASVLQPYRLFGGLSSMQLPDTRKSGYVKPGEEIIQLSAIFENGSDVSPAVISSGFDINKKYFSIKQSGTKASNGYRVDIEMVEPALDITANEYAVFYNELSLLDKAGHWVVAYLPDEPEIHTELDDSDDFSHQLAIAKNMMEIGDFKGALKHAESAVSLNGSSGEAWYILGMAQGFEAMINESMSSFEKASALGYTP